MMWKMYLAKELSERSLAKALEKLACSISGRANYLKTYISFKFSLMKKEVEY